MDTKKTEIKKEPVAAPDMATATPPAPEVSPEPVDKLQMILDALMDIKAMLMEEEEVELSAKPVGKDVENVSSKVPEKVKLPETPEDKVGFAKTDIKKEVETVLKDMGIKTVGETPKPEMETVAKTETKDETGMSILERVRKGEDLSKIGHALTDKSVDANRKMYDEVFKK